MNLEARDAIENALGRYALAVDDIDIPAILDIFTKDAVFTARIAGGETFRFEGHDGIGALMAADLSPERAYRHVITNIVIRQASDDRAKSECYLTLLLVEASGIRLLTTGRYFDDWVHQDGHWRIQVRHLDVALMYK